MLNWLKDTFKDANGVPSFKRQSSAVLIIACIAGAFYTIDIQSLAFLAGAILGSTAVEKFTKK